MINDLFKNCDFNELTIEDCKEKILSHLPQSFKYSYSYGCYKLVIIPKNISNIVIKIPFSGEYVNHTYYPFEENTIEKEIYLYNKAKENNIQYLFAENISIGSSTNPIYIQPYCIISEDYDNDSYSYDHCYSYYNDSIDELWQSMVCNCYGEDVLRKLNDFIEEYEIEDLHNSNIGFRASDTISPIIIDYAGIVDTQV